MEEAQSFGAVTSDMRQAHIPSGPGLQRHVSPAQLTASRGHQTVSMRIDNVAWVLAPLEHAIAHEIVGCNPSNRRGISAAENAGCGSLDTHSAGPVRRTHKGLSRTFYVSVISVPTPLQYIEVASPHAAREILKTRQNHFMPGGSVIGGRKRPVTIVLVTHAELIAEVCFTLSLSYPCLWSSFVLDQ